MGFGPRQTPEQSRVAKIKCGDRRATLDLQKHELGGELRNLWNLVDEGLKGACLLIGDGSREVPTVVVLVYRNAVVITLENMFERVHGV